MLNRWIARLVLTGCLAGCASTTTVRTALVRGDQQAVDRFVDDFLAGRLSIDRAALKDDRAAATDLVIRISDRTRASQYRVQLVSDVFMCLLQVKARRSTREILDLGDDQYECRGEDTCEVCNSFVYPLSPQLRARLRDHWLRAER
jgi:hypothetical protein